MWSNDILSIVYTKVKSIVGNQLGWKYPDLNFTTSARVQKNPEFPVVYLRKLQGAEVGRDLDGETVNAIVSSIQIECVDNDKQNRADEVADAVMGAMRSMRYEIVGDIVIDDSDPSVYRNTARYRRIVGHGDVL